MNKGLFFRTGRGKEYPVEIIIREDPKIGKIAVFRLGDFSIPLEGV